MERPQDFEEREQPPAEVNAEIAETAGDPHEDPARDERAEGVSGAEDQPDI